MGATQEGFGDTGVLFGRLVVVPIIGTDEVVVAQDGGAEQVPLSFREGELGEQCS